MFCLCHMIINILYHYNSINVIYVYDLPSATFKVFITSCNVLNVSYLILGNLDGSDLKHDIKSLSILLTEYIEGKFSL